MEIRLKEIKLRNEENKKFEKFIDNSYNEWLNNWNNVKETENKNPWEAKFEIIYNDKIGEFTIDTEGEYLSFMDLEGYLNGEEYELEEGLSLKIASVSSNILVAVVFSEAIRLNLIDEDESSYLSMHIFPEWSRGLIPNDVLEEDDVKEFFDTSLAYLKAKKIIDIYPVNIGEIEVLALEKKEEFEKFVKEYIPKDIYFYTLKK